MKPSAHLLTGFSLFFLLSSGWVFAEAQGEDLNSVYPANSVYNQNQPKASAFGKPNPNQRFQQPQQGYPSGYPSNGNAGVGNSPYLPAPPSSVLQLINRTGNASAAPKTTLSVRRNLEDEDDYVDGGPNLFTVTNTNIGFTWDKLPYREKYQWDTDKAPCHSFHLQVPDEKAEKSGIILCIYRPHLEFLDDTELFIHHVENPETVGENKDLKVYGSVKGVNGSKVFGRIVDTYFYGEVSLPDNETESDIVYVVEEIKILTKLMRYNEKILKNMLFVMNNGAPPSVKYNAVVTKGASLMNFMISVNPSEFVRGSFLVFSTSHNSYITAGEPLMEVDESGKVTFNAGDDKIVIATDLSVRLISRHKEYIFRPNGKTVVHEGNQVDTLQEHEGAVAVSAFTSETSYGCILPTPAFNLNRKGGYLCKVCLAADRLFLKHFMSAAPVHETAVHLLGRMIDRVSWIFRSIDWNGDNLSDNVGLDYDPQFSKWIYPDSGSEDVNPEELEILFGSLNTIDFSDCCVGITYTMKRLPGDTIAKSSIAKPSTPGGVCAVQTDGQFNNLILISANDKSGGYGRISEEQLTYVTANQLAKAFGAGPDGTGQDSCDQFLDKGEVRHYIMWPDVLRNITMDEKSVSPCSKKGVQGTLESCKSACFDVDKHPFCGNGIVEDGEECDCGSESDCSKQTCCYPRNGKHPCMKSGIGCKKRGVKSGEIEAENSAPTYLKSSSSLIFILTATLGSLSSLF